jgi:hypothetical protein
MAAGKNDDHIKALCRWKTKTPPGIQTHELRGLLPQQLWQRPPLVTIDQPQAGVNNIPSFIINKWLAIENDAFPRDSIKLRSTHHVLNESK